jgi:DNA polymerase III epsilon subunit-like protein
MKYVSIDLETSGLNPERHNVIQIACIIEDTTVQAPIEELPTLNLFVKHKEYVGQDFALGLNGWIMDILSERAPLPEGAQIIDSKDVNHIVRRFFHEQNAKVGDTVFAAGKCFNSFDRPFLQNQHNLKFHRRVLDPMMLYCRPEDEKPPGMGDCCERAGIIVDESKLHDAVYDAQLVIALIRKVWYNN